MSNEQHVRILDALVAQRIAAGEVIERPASVVRELIDNAIDAGATAITVQTEQGGLDRITVIDDGDGISSEDMPLLCSSHATSKVHTIEDLFHIQTMGFRGEALYSIAACSKIVIASSYHGQEAQTLVVDNGRRQNMSPGGPQTGTRIEVFDLFGSIPARRQFLKRPATESTMCKHLVAEKAAAFPSISFKYYEGDQLRLNLIPDSPKKRIIDILSTDSRVIPSEFVEIEEHAGRFSLKAIAATSAVHRSDRSQIKIYVNNRLVDEYALVQAVVHAYGTMLPGGAFPYCYLFVHVDPQLVDFNIHPAKKEVKLRNKAEIHHEVVSMIQRNMKASIPRLGYEDLRTNNTQLEFTSEAPKGFPESNYPDSGNKHFSRYASNQHDTAKRSEEKPVDPFWLTKAQSIMKDRNLGCKQSNGNIQKHIEATPKTWRYIGQTFNTFLIVEQGDELLLVDQHAAHERMIFDAIRTDGSIQELMVPIEFEVDRDVDEFIMRQRFWYADYGLALKRTGDLTWELSTIPAVWKSIEPEIVEFIATQAGNPLDLDKRLYATLACHDAVKSGDTLDSLSAEHILEAVFSMDQTVCPHGRNFIAHISRESLFKAVGRLV